MTEDKYAVIFKPAKGGEEKRREEGGENENKGLELGMEAAEWVSADDQLLL